MFIFTAKIVVFVNDQRDDVSDEILETTGETWVCLHASCLRCITPRVSPRIHVWACLCRTDVRKIVVRMSRNIRVGINKKRNQVSKTNWVYNNCFTFE